MNHTCCGHVFSAMSLYRCLGTGEYCKTGRGKNRLSVKGKEYGICPICKRQVTPTVVDNFSIRSETVTYIVTNNTEYRLKEWDGTGHKWVWEHERTQRE